MAKTAPMVTRAVESHSTPMSNHSGRGLCMAAAGGSIQDSSSGSALRNVADARSIAAISPLQLVAISSGERAGIVRVHLREVAERIQLTNLVYGRSAFRAVGGGKIQMMLRHGAHPYLPGHS